MQPSTRCAEFLSKPSTFVFAACMFLLVGCMPPTTPDTPDPDDQAPDDALPLIELTEEPRDKTDWELITDQMNTNGTITKEVALQAFALLMGDIPGVTPPTGEPSDVSCGTLPVYWISQFEEELSADELAAIESALGTSTDDGIETARVAIFGDHSCTTGNDAISEDQDGAEVYRPILDQELAKLEQAFGRPLGIPVYISLGLGKAGGSVLAWASPQASSSCATEAATSCRIEIFVNREQFNDENELRRVLSHELTHCYQATFIPATKALRKPHWLLEGFPEYVSYVLNPTAKRGWFNTYASTPLKHLFTRTYDAVGFYFQLHTVGVPVIDRFETAFGAEDNSEAFAYLVQPEEMEFGDTWASSFALEMTRGSAWFMPEAPNGLKSYVSMGQLDNGKRFYANPGEAGVRIAHIDFNADIVSFKATGPMNGRVSWDNMDDVLLSDVNGLLFCRKDGGCMCPEGSTGSPTQIPIPSNSAIVAVSGTTMATTLEIAGFSLDEYCQDDSVPDPPAAEGVDPCIVGNWVSDEWVLPGPFSDLDGRGGNNAVVNIRANGVATWDFDNMQPITTEDDQIGVVTELYSRGTATAHIAAGDGNWDISERDITQLDAFAIDNILGQSALVGGPGLFVLLGDGAYTCSGSLLSYSSVDPVTDATVSVTLHKQ
ncbi:MAG TPA: hypothetical protein PKN33_19075 [Phycisphaerae bacterium]|nr:hypothetical protein [Phycisphaerae bacterium]